MTTTPPEAPSGPTPPPEDHGPRVTREEVRDLGRLRRTIVDKKVAGVAGGLGRHFDVDPVILRVAFVVLAFFGGAGLLLYGACWLLLPEDGAAEAPLHLDERSRMAALAIVGGLAVLVVLGDSWGFVGFPWPVLIVAAVALVLLSKGKHSPPPVVPPGNPWAAPGATPPPPPPGWAAGPAAPGGYPRPATPGDPALGGHPTGSPTGFGPGIHSGMHPQFHSGSGWGSHSGLTAGPQPGVQPGPYAAPHPGTATYPTTPPATPPPAYLPPVRPRDPRRRGPVLFWFSMALAALTVGVLGVLDISGTDVAPGAYPAAVVAVCGVMLLVGAFWGRAGGLIAIGLLATVGTVIATAAGEIEGTTQTERPLSAAQVRSDYRIEAGELELDLTDVSDLEALDGRTLRLDNNAGEVRVIVPDELDVDVTAEMHGVGGIDVFGDESGGFGVRDQAFHDAGAGDAPRIDLEIEVNVGQITVETR